MYKLIVTKDNNPICFGREELVKRYFKENYSPITHKIMSKEKWNMGNYGVLPNNDDEIVEVHNELMLRSEIEKRKFFKIKNNNVKIPINIDNLEPNDVVDIYEGVKKIGRFLVTGQPRKKHNGIMGIECERLS